jgi:hypothetical protein
VHVRVSLREGTIFANWRSRFKLVCTGA